MATNPYSEIDIPDIDLTDLGKEDVDVSPAASPRLEVIATPRDQAFPEENIITEIDEDTDVDEVFGVDNKGNNTLRAGKFDRIIKWIAFEDTNDAELEAFFVSYQMISMPRELLDTFTKIYTEILEDSEQDKNEINAKAKRFLFQLVESGNVDTDIIPTITTFASKNFNSAETSEIKMKLMKYKHSVSLQESPVFTALDAPSIFKSISELYHIPNDKITSYPEDGILGFTSSHMAENLTLLESALFSRIQRSEYFNHTKPALSPNITHFAQHFNMVSSWVAAEIFSTEPIRQVPVLKKFINLCVKLLDMKNYNGSMEILCGLNNSALQRYKKIWDNIPARYTEILSQVEQTLSPLRNFRNYRNSLSSSMSNKQPVVPYLAGHLKDLIFADEGNTTRNGLVSFEKLSMVGKIVSQLLKSSHVPYLFQPREDLLKFFTNLWWLDSDDLRSCSFAHEPKRMTGSNSFEDNPQEPKHKDAWIESVSALSCTKQRSGILPGFSKEVHKYAYDIAKLLYAEDTLIHKTRIWRGVVYRDCLSAYEAINTLQTLGLCDNRRAGVEIGSMLLKCGYFKPVGKYTSTFVDKFSAWYQFTTEDVPGFEEGELRSAQKITEIQERTDKCILIAISSSIGGIQPRIFWSGMNSSFCFSGAELVAWLSDNMKIPRTEALELCCRLFSRGFLTPVKIVEEFHPEMIPDSFLDSEKHFYDFALKRPRRIAKQAEIAFQDKEESKKGSRRRKNKASKSIALLEELNITPDELRMFCVMLDPFAGIPTEGNSKTWAGPSIIHWIHNHQKTTEAEATKFALSLHERKILIPASEKEKKPPGMKGNSCFQFSSLVLSLCENHKQKGGTTVSTGDARRATISTASGGGPVLYERAEEARNRSGTSSTVNTIDPVLVETHQAIQIMLDLCDPVTGIKRSDVRFNNQSQKLFSGKKFIAWFESNKQYTESKGKEIFTDLASRGFLVTLHGTFPHVFDNASMYRFCIEKGDGIQRDMQLQKANNASSLLESEESDMGSPKREEKPAVIQAPSPAPSPSDVQALVQSRMGGIENPNFPVRRQKTKKKRTKEKKNRRTVDLVRLPTEPSTVNTSSGYKAPMPAILERGISTESMLSDTKATKRAGSAPNQLKQSHKASESDMGEGDTTDVGEGETTDVAEGDTADGTEDVGEYSVTDNEVDEMRSYGGESTGLDQDPISNDSQLGLELIKEPKNESQSAALSEEVATDDSYDVIDADVDASENGVMVFESKGSDSSGMESSYETREDEAEEKIEENTDTVLEEELVDELFDQSASETPVLLKRVSQAVLAPPKAKQAEETRQPCTRKASYFSLEDLSVGSEELPDSPVKQSNEPLDHLVVASSTNLTSLDGDISPKEAPGDDETLDVRKEADLTETETSLVEGDVQARNISSSKLKLRRSRSRSRDKLGKFLASATRASTEGLPSQHESDFTGSLLTQLESYSIWLAMIDPEKGIPLSSHKIKKKTFPKCFSGTEACTWLNEYLPSIPDMQDYDPFAVAQDMLAAGFFEPLNNKNKHVFEAGNINFYHLKTKEALESDQTKKTKKRSKLFM